MERIGICSNFHFLNDTGLRFALVSDDDMTALGFYSRLGHRKWQTPTQKWGASSRASTRLRSAIWPSW